MDLNAQIAHLQGAIAQHESELNKMRADLGVLEGQRRRAELSALVQESPLQAGAGMILEQVPQEIHRGVAGFPSSSASVHPEYSKTTELKGSYGSGIPKMLHITVPEEKDPEPVSALGKGPSLVKLF